MKNNLTENMEEKRSETLARKGENNNIERIKVRIGSVFDPVT